MAITGKSVMAILGVVFAFVISFIIIPMIGETAETAVPLGTTSAWNGSVTTGLTTGVEAWTTFGGLMILLVLILVVTPLMKSFMQK